MIIAGLRFKSVDTVDDAKETLMVWHTVTSRRKVEWKFHETHQNWIVDHAFEEIVGRFETVNITEVPT